MDEKSFDYNKKETYFIFRKVKHVLYDNVVKIC